MTGSVLIQSKQSYLQGTQESENISLENPEMYACCFWNFGVLEKPA